MRLLAAALSALPKAKEGTIYGNAIAPAAIPVAFLRSRRRLKYPFSDIIKVSSKLVPLRPSEQKTYMDSEAPNT
jgi:hypothetical protein